jgi:hypothetical protein
MARVFLFALLVLGASAVYPDVASFLQEAKNRPVTKVINLLKDMLKQMEKEGEEDEDIYEKFGCWCTTNEKAKTKSIADAQAMITTLQTTIESTTADSARLGAEIANLQSELEKNNVALGEATALRAKQLAEFNTEEKELLQALVSLKSAIQVLSKQHEGSFIQVSDSQTIQMDLMVHSLQKVLRFHQQHFPESVIPKQRKAVEKWAASLGTERHVSLLQTEYNPQSGAIFGILKQMKEDMETSLAKSRSEEERNVAEFESLKKAKTQQIADAEDLVEVKSGELATSDEKKATSKVDLEETQTSLDADNKFLADLKVRCVDMDAQYAERTKTRQLEMEAVSKALEFLSSDEAHDLFTRTFNPAFLQTNTVSRTRSVVAKLLKKASEKARDPRLAALAVRARLDAFEEVKKTIQDMIDKLLKEKDDDVKHKDYCIDEFNANDVDTQNKQREKEQKEAKIEDLTQTIEQLDQAIETLKSEINDLQLNQKSASIARVKANKDYQQTVSDQKATQELITTALKVLKTFYDKAALVQVSSQKGGSASKQPPPPGFKTYEKSASSGGVMGVMQDIIVEAKGLEEEAVRGEEEAQTAFEEFTRDTTQSIKDKTNDSHNKAEEKAQAEALRVQTETERDTNLQELEELAQVNADLHKSCDFLMKNFDARVEARDSEVEALKQGLAIFTGASFAALLQRGQ